MAKPKTSPLARLPASDKAWPLEAAFGTAQRSRRHIHRQESDDELDKQDDRQYHVQY